MRAEVGIYSFKTELSSRYNIKLGLLLRFYICGEYGVTTIRNLVSFETVIRLTSEEV